MFKYDNTITVARRGTTRHLATSGDAKRATHAGSAATGSSDPVFVSLSQPGTSYKPERVTPTSHVQAPAPLPPTPATAVETAYAPAPLPSAQANTASSLNVDPNIMGPVLAEYVQDDQHNGQPNVTLNRIYWDIYYNDTTAGSAVDMFSKMPFSEFSITGLRDEKTLRPFLESCENIQALKLLPEATVDYYVVGHHTGALSWNATRNVYGGYVAFDGDHVRMQDVLNYGDDPIITANVHPAQKAALESTEPAFEEARRRLDPDLLERLKQRDAVLRPEELIYIPRRARIRDFMGRSYFRRILAVWFMEKALLRGTLDSAYKRQKAIRHITAGDGEEWIPTSDEMTAIANLFLKAEIDPLSSIVVTREGINVNELGSPDAFWRWDQNYDQFSTIKLRGLGITESIITGEANFATLDQSLSVFVEGVRAFRQVMTQEFFYDKMFPRISYANNFLARRYGVERANWSVGNTGVHQAAEELWGTVSGSLLLSSELGATGFDTRNIDLTKYAIPKVHWHKRLMPEADSAYLEILGTLSDRGLKIPLRMWAAAGGLDLNSLMEDKPDDIKLAEDMRDWAKQTQPYNPELEAQQGGGGMEFSSTSAGTIIARPARRVGMAQRVEAAAADTEADGAQFIDRDSQGNRRLLTRQGRDIIENRFNRRLAEALASVARRTNHMIRQDYAEYKESK